MSVVTFQSATPATPPVGTDIKVTDSGAGLVQHVNMDNLPGLDIPTHDYISLGYTGSNLTSVVYKIGGAGGTTVATLTIAYDGSNITSVTKT